MTVTGESDRKIKSMAFTPCSFLLLFRKSFFVAASVNVACATVSNVPVGVYQVQACIRAIPATQSVFYAIDISGTGYQRYGRNDLASGFGVDRLNGSLIIRVTNPTNSVYVNVYVSESDISLYTSLVLAKISD